jgi:hypothetical protein
VALIESVSAICLLAGWDGEAIEIAELRAERFLMKFEVKKG